MEKQEKVVLTLDSYEHGIMIRALNELAKKRGQTLAEMALSWILKDGDVTSVLIGASRPEQILDNIAIVGHTSFTPEELDAIDQITL